MYSNPLVLVIFPMSATSAVVGVETTWLPELSTLPEPNRASRTPPEIAVSRPETTMIAPTISAAVDRFAR